MDEAYLRVCHTTALSVAMSVSFCLPHLCMICVHLLLCCMYVKCVVLFSESEKLISHSFYE